MELPTFIIIAVAFIFLFWLFAITVRECDNLRHQNANLKYQIKKLEKQIFTLKKDIEILREGNEHLGIYRQN